MSSLVALSPKWNQILCKTFFLPLPQPWLQSLLPKNAFIRLSTGEGWDGIHPDFIRRSFQKLRPALILSWHVYWRHRQKLAQFPGVQHLKTVITPKTSAHLFLSAAKNRIISQPNSFDIDSDNWSKTPQDSPTSVWRHLLPLHWGDYIIFPKVLSASSVYRFHICRFGHCQP